MVSWKSGFITLSAVAALLSACQQAPEQQAGGVSRSAPAVTAASAPAPAAKLMAKPMLLPGAAIAMPFQGDRFTEVRPSTWAAVVEQPVSTFSLDVDTASYAYVRRSLREGRLPPADAVRVEEMVNYFPYAYAGPQSKDQPFAVAATVTPSPWKPGAKLLHVGLKAWDADRTQRPPARLTFLIDVSGSMAPSDRLALIQSALRQLGEGLRPDDQVAIVTYAGEAGVKLEPTAGDQLDKIVAVVDGLKAAGGTAGGAGLRTAYQLARQMKTPGAINRVILATDGDFNLGETNPRQLEQLIGDYRRDGIYLTILGVGTGNLNDALMQRLAQSGNGQAAYLDTVQEARKVWVEELGSTMAPVADDVKAQVEFNPATVAEYRLIGYETRTLAQADFRDDRVDAGDIGAGHSVTALYEFMPKGAANTLIEPRRYGKMPPSKGNVGEYAMVKVRSKKPGTGTSLPLEVPVRVAGQAASLDQASDDVRFSVAIAGFAQILRGQMPATAWEDTIALADGARGPDRQGWRAEAVQLMRLAASLKR